MSSIVKEESVNKGSNHPKDKKPEILGEVGEDIDISSL
jgi:hypothetical protein